MGYSHENYDKISAVVGYVCPGLVMKHSVKLSRKDSVDKRLHYHSEYVYSTKTYSDVKRLASMKLDIASSLTLESIDRSDKVKINVWLSGKQLMALRRGLRSIDNWFYDGSLNVFVMVDGKLTVNNSIETREVVKLYRQMITFRPVVIEQNDSRYEGLEMNIFDERTTSTKAYIMNLDEHDMFYDTIKGFDLYSAGLALINYLGRPNLGTNMYDLDSSRKNVEGNDDSNTAGGFKSTYKGNKNINTKKVLGM